MSLIELMTLASLLGMTHVDYVERKMHVLIVTAKAHEISRARIKRDFSDATFFYGEEDVPRDPNNGSGRGHLSLPNTSDDDPTVSTRFSVGSGVHTLTMSAENFLDVLGDLSAAQRDQFYFGDVHGTPLSEIKIENLQADSVKNRILHLLPRRRPSGEATMMDPSSPSGNGAGWEYPNIRESAIVYIASQSEMRTRLNRWAPAIKSASLSQPSSASWKVGAEIFGEQYRTATLKIKIEDGSRLNPEPATALPELAISSHVLSPAGWLVAPEIHVGNAPRATEVEIPSVTKMMRNNVPIVSGFSLDAETLIESILRPHLGRASDAPISCYINPAGKEMSLCAESRNDSQRQVVSLNLGDMETKSGSFFLEQKDASVTRRWKITMELSVTGPVVEDVEIFPVTKEIE